MKGQMRKTGGLKLGREEKGQYRREREAVGRNTTKDV